MGIEIPVRKALEITAGLDGAQWAEHAFGAVQLGDERLNRRLVESARIQAEKPGESCSGAGQGDWPLVKGYYRMIDKPDECELTPQAASLPRYLRTHDTTDVGTAHGFVYSGWNRPEL
ncbi:MAG: IS4/Tn5 family transposase DNA-binding protein [Methylococcales bacterium]